MFGKEFLKPFIFCSASYTGSSDEDDGISPREKQQVGNNLSQKPDLQVQHTKGFEEFVCVKMLSELVLVYAEA